MKQISVNGEKLGPFNSVVELDDRYDCDGVHYPYTIFGGGTIEDWVEPVVEPVIIEETTNV